MPTSHLFAYNTGTTLSGTVQVGDLAISKDDIDYKTVYPTYDWWNGPIEDIGFVVAHPTPDGSQPNQSSVPAYLGFWRSKLLTEESFLSLATWIANSEQYFITGTQAKMWLNGQGYWTSFLSGSSVTFYSGNTYDPLWVSGNTITPPSTTLNVYDYQTNSLFVSFVVGGFGALTDTWQTVASYDFSGYQSLISDISVSGFGGGVQISLILTDGISSLSTTTTSTGAQNLSLDISSWVGLGQIQLEITSFGNGYYFDLEIFSVYVQV